MAGSGGHKNGSVIEGNFYFGWGMMLSHVEDLRAHRWIEADDRT
jgi:hypothetical protein